MKKTAIDLFRVRGTARRTHLLTAFLAFIPLFALAGQGLTLTAGLDQTRFLAGTQAKAFLKIGLVGREGSTRARPALNVALVLDRSGSMEGEKLEQAKEAARFALSLLKPQDILSIVVYDDEVSVLLPATRFSDAARIRRLIDGIESGGSTALFAGVSKGAAELRKFLDRDQVNRVILLSDGLANIGPDSPGALAELGTSLRREGISVTTLGLGSGYNEDLMVRLAGASDGNHAFVESPRDLVRIFDAEFRDAMSIAALDVRVTVTCAPGVVPLRIMNRDGDIRGRVVTVNLNQVLGSQEKYILVELELPAGRDGQSFVAAETSVSYRNQQTRKTEGGDSLASLVYSNDVAQVERSVQKGVKAEVVLQLATEANEEAVRLRDQGRIEEAKQALEANSSMLKDAAASLSAPSLDAYAQQNEQAAQAIDDEDWNATRKTMREEQYQNMTQQSY